MDDFVTSFPFDGVLQFSRKIARRVESMGLLLDWVADRYEYEPLCESNTATLTTVLIGRTI